MYKFKIKLERLQSSQNIISGLYGIFGADNITSVNTWGILQYKAKMSVSFLKGKILFST